MQTPVTVYRKEYNMASEKSKICGVIGCIACKHSMALNFHHMNVAFVGPESGSKDDRKDRYRCGCKSCSAVQYVTVQYGADAGN